MKVDLHIHSALSPCANDDMTPHNIVNMARLAGLECISVCDHNSFAQQKMMAHVAHELGMKYVYGIEVQSVEDVHICIYFLEEEKGALFGQWVYEHLLPIENDIRYFGNQWICNALDEFVNQEKRLLIQSIDQGIASIADRAHELGGIVSLAHVCDKTNSILTQLGFIPENLGFDMIEVKNEPQKEKVLRMHPWIQDPFWVRNSDAHYLQDIGIYEDEIDEKKFYDLWRKAL